MLPFIIQCTNFITGINQTWLPKKKEQNFPKVGGKKRGEKMSSSDMLISNEKNLLAEMAGNMGAWWVINSLQMLQTCTVSFCCLPCLRWNDEGIRGKVGDPDWFLKTLFIEHIGNLVSLSFLWGKNWKLPKSRQNYFMTEIIHLKKKTETKLETKYYTAIVVFVIAGSTNANICSVGLKPHPLCKRSTRVAFCLLQGSPV